MPNSGASSPEGVDFKTIAGMSEELAEALLAVITAGDSAEELGMYRGFTLAELTTSDILDGAQFHSDCKMSGYQKGREIRLFLEGLFRGLHEGFHHTGSPIPRAESAGATSTFIIGYNLGYSLGRAGRKQEIEKSGRVSDRAFQHFLRRFGISIVGEETSPTPDQPIKEDPNSRKGNETMTTENEGSTPKTEGSTPKTEVDKKVNWTKVGKITSAVVGGIVVAGGAGFACYTMGKKNGLNAGMAGTSQTM